MNKNVKDLLTQQTELEQTINKAQKTLEEVMGRKRTLGFELVDQTKEMFEEAMESLKALGCEDLLPKLFAICVNKENVKVETLIDNKVKNHNENKKIVEELEKVKAQLTEKISHASNLEDNIRNLKTEISNKDNKIEELNQLISKLEDKLNNVQAVEVKDCNQCDKTLVEEELKEELKAVKIKFKNLERNHEKTKENNKKYREIIKDLKKENSKDVKSNADVKLQEALQELADLKEKNSQLVKENAQLIEEQNKMRKFMKDYQTSANAKLDEKSEGIEMLKKENAQNVKILKDEIDILRSEIAELTADRAAIECELNEVKSSLKTGKESDKKNNKGVDDNVKNTLNKATESAKNNKSESTKDNKNKIVEEAQKNVKNVLDKAVDTAKSSKGLNIIDENDRCIMGTFDGVPFMAAKRVNATTVYDVNKYGLAIAIEKALVELGKVDPNRKIADPNRLESPVGVCHKYNSHAYQGFIVRRGQIYMFTYDENVMAALLKKYPEKKAFLGDKASVFCMNTTYYFKDKAAREGNGNKFFGKDYQRLILTLIENREKQINKKKVDEIKQSGFDNSFLSAFKSDNKITRTTAANYKFFKTDNNVSNTLNTNTLNTNTDTNTSDTNTSDTNTDTSDANTYNLDTITNADCIADNSDNTITNSDNFDFDPIAFHDSLGDDLLDSDLMEE